MRLSALLAIVLVLVPLAAHAAEGDAGVHINFDDSVPTDAESPQTYFSPVETLFNNPALASGLASGADAINRSVESLMDSLFYSLLDNEKNLRISDHAWFTTQLKRDVYSTASGAYVVVDRIALGPRYARELWRVQNIPVSLGVDGTVNVLQIYLRTDGARIAEQEELPAWRRWVNTWFGLLPALATVLPPSFNQNELYDPIRQLETPFVFPLDAAGFYSMPVGSIRSYAISGGAQLPIDLAGVLDKPSQDLLERTGSFQRSMPYSIFRRGEHGIYVLRRGEHVAWVGLKELDRTGHSLSPLVGTKYFILQGALAAQVVNWRWVWAGVPVPLLPIDISVEQAVADLYDQVYEFDLRNPVAQEAYVAAVKGDFATARARYLDAHEKGVDTGVAFHFARTQERQEVISRNGPNLAVARAQRKGGLSRAEIEITDSEGKFYILEGTQDIADERWDILVGEEETRHQQTVEMRVRKVLDKEAPDDPSRYSFVFEADEDPIALTLGLSIQDRYVDAREYEGYVEDLRYFSMLPLANVPRIEEVDPELLAERRRRGFFVEPRSSIALRHVPPTYLGRFGAQALISFSTEELNRVLSRSTDAKWAAFARAFGQDPETWSDPEVRASLGFQLQWFKAFFLYPLRLLNVRVAAADAIKEATAGVQALDRIKALETPVEKLDAFHELFDTDHPERLVRVLLDLADLDRLPRRVAFSAQPKGAARQEIKKRYGRLNGLVDRAGPPFPEPDRYERAKKKLAAFYLDQPREAEDRPRISRIMVTTRAVPESVRGLGPNPDELGPERPYDRDAKQVYVTLTVTNASASSPLRLYVRVEQAGRIKIGKLELAERVIPMEPAATAAPATADLGTLTYELYLTGPMSPLSTEGYDQAMARGEDLLVTLAASRDGAVWSDERSLEFRYENGRLMPPSDN